MLKEYSAKDEHNSDETLLFYKYPTEHYFSRMKEALLESGSKRDLLYRCSQIPQELTT
jgi:hypothetical protein